MTKKGMWRFCGRLNLGSSSDDDVGRSDPDYPLHIIVLQAIMAKMNIKDTEFASNKLSNHIRNGFFEDIWNTNSG